MKHRHSFFLSILLPALFCLGCSHQHVKTNTFVLVHGAWQGAWVWSTVKANLEKAGNKVVVIELPGHGTDTTPPMAASITAYRDRVLEALRSLPGKIILVGHSMGGIVVSAVAESVPDKIQKLVYVAAFVPANGQSLLDLAAQDKTSLLGPSIVPSEDGLTLGIVSDQIVPIFCQDAPAIEKNDMLDHYRPEPAIPFADKATLTTANFGKVEKVYIHTSLDHAIGIENQTKMADSAHITHTYTLESGHSPFLSQPDDLSKLFLLIAN